MSKPTKTVRWIASSKQELQALPKPARGKIGHALWEAQKGGMPPGAKVLQGFGGASVLEIRADHDGNAYRAVYTVRFAEVIYVLLVFQKESKKGSKTPPNVIELIQKRLRVAENEHEQWKSQQENGD